MARMTWRSSRRALHVLDLGLEELVALTELGRSSRANGLTGPMAQLRLELSDAGGGGDALGQFGDGRAHGVLGPQPRSRRQGSTTDSRRRWLHQVQLAFCSRLRAAASSCSLTDRWRRSSSSRAPRPARPRAGGGPARGVTDSRQSSPDCASATTPEQALDRGGVGLEPVRRSAACWRSSA